MVNICLQYRRPGFDPWVRKFPWRRKWQPTPVFLPGKSHGWRSLVGYSPWGRKELDTTERLHLLTYCIERSIFISSPGCTQTSLDHFFKRAARTESSTESKPVPSTSDMSEMATFPPSPIADDPSALPSSSEYLFLPLHLMPAPVCQLLYGITILFKILYCKIKIFSLFFALCMYYFCKNY